jgi:hypothetical protein
MFSWGDNSTVSWEYVYALAPALPITRMGHSPSSVTSARFALFPLTTGNSVMGPRPPVRARHELFGAFMTPSFLLDNGQTLYFVMSMYGAYNTVVPCPEGSAAPAARPGLQPGQNPGNSKPGRLAY